MSFSRNVFRSETEQEFASEVVPKTTNPSQPFSRSHRQWAIVRCISNSARSLNADKTGAKTPLILDAVIPDFGPGARLLQTGWKVSVERILPKDAAPSSNGVGGAARLPTDVGGRF
jgi:hypothetical protein